MGQALACCNGAQEFFEFTNCKINYYKSSTHLLIYYNIAP